MRSLYHARRQVVTIHPDSGTIEVSYPIYQLPRRLHCMYCIISAVAGSTGYTPLLACSTAPRV